MRPVRPHGSQSEDRSAVPAVPAVRIACRLAGLLLTFAAHAAAPVLDTLFPAAVQLGTTHAVVAVGKAEPWPPKVWVDAPGIRFEPTTNSGTFSVVIAPDAPVGPHLVRVFNDDGASAPRFLVVTRAPQTAEVEPDDDFTKPQPIATLPSSINGRLEKSGDVDSFAVELTAGQTLVASVEAYTLMSPLDAVLRLVDARGVVLAMEHDDGRTFDPLLTWTARSAGRHIVQVFGFAYPAESEVRFTGNAKCVYRLHLSVGPVVSHTVPLGVRRGVRTPLRVFGWNLGKDVDREVVSDVVPAASAATRTEFLFPGADRAVVLPVGDGPESVESEPNGTPAQANQIEIPGAVTGRIAEAGDEDRFVFKAKKDEKLSVEVRSAAFGFPLDAWLKVEDMAGKELAKSDDSTGADPGLVWSAPADGEFVLAVGNLVHRGGPDHLYRLAIARPVASMKATVAADGFVVEPGKTNEVKVSIARQHGFAAKLVVSVKGLPASVKSAPVEVAEAGAEAVLKWIADVDAKPSAGPVEIVLAETGPGREHRAAYELATTGENNGVPQGFKQLVIGSIEKLWLTVPPPPAPKTDAKAEVKK